MANPGLGVAEPRHARIEVEIFRRIGGDAGDVMDAV
jgi:hypothetical protein